MGESYVGAIGTYAPRQAADLLRARMQSGREANERLAEWVQDYTQLLSKHASELERFTAKHVIDDSQLGTLAQPWQSVAQLALEQARSSLDAARRAGIETEKPLRDTHWPQIERTLDQLESGAVPPAEGIDKLQRLDTERLSAIKTSLARFATIEVDRAQAQTNAAEHAAQAWLGYDPRDDVAAYVAQVVSGVAPAASRSSGQRQASAATQVSTQSDATVKRRSSLRFGSSSNVSAAGDEPRSNLRSKVGSLFGRKKKGGAKDSRLETTREDTPDNSSFSSRPRTTRPPDFGIRAPSPIRRGSQASVRSGASNTSDLYSQPSPRRPASGADGAALGAAAGFGASSGGGYGAPAGYGADSHPGPIAPGNHAPPASSPLAQRPQNLPPVSIAGQSGSGMFAPLTPTKVTSPRGSPGTSPRGSIGSPTQHGSPQHGSPQHGSPQHASAFSNPGPAPAPPPARHQPMLNRQPSLGRTPSNASFSALQRSASLQRTPSQRERVNSQLFSNMAPTESASAASAAGAGGGFMAPIPATPQHNGPGSPQEQFWTPAARFSSQFGQFDANGSMASLATRPAEMPPVPRGEGLVAAAVERITATFVGDELVSSSVSGDAVAQITGTNTTVALGVLLADPQARLTPSSNLIQTSSLSFEVPPALYGNTTQDLVSYESATALGRVPIKVTPLWRVEATMVRLVLSYQLSDLYVGSDAVTVNNLIIAVSVGGRGRAHSAQSKPVATFSREKQRVTWRFNEPVTLRRGQPPQKLLAQFVLEGLEPVEPGPIDVRLKLAELANPVLQLRTLTPNGEWVPVPTAIAGSVTADVQNRSPGTAA